MSSPNPNSGFRYEPLDHSRQQFRVLRIVPSMSDTISCELKISTELASRPFYKALSYTWGSLLPARQILVNGEPFTVRENLYQFLRTIHHEKPTFFFFIDQICIDQSNVQERNHQVNFMGQIYHEAIQVVAWLGPAADGSDEAMFWISRSQSHTSHYRRNDPVSLNYLFQRAYWKRIWILQEIMLARSLVVRCGNSTVVWSKFEQFFKIPWTLRALPGAARDNFVGTGTRHEAWTIVNEKAEISSGQRLGYILETFERWKCEKPHDKVYGLLGLVPEHCRVPIDYEKSLYEIFTDVIYRVVHDEWHLDVKNHVDLGRRLKHSLNSGQSYSELSSLDVEHYVRMIHAEQRTAKRPPI